MILPDVTLFLFLRRNNIDRHPTHPNSSQACFPWEKRMSFWRGGIISFARREQKVALDVNLTAATAAEIKIRSKLLIVASVVKGKL
ncbi:MAG: YfiR/HmsC family protein [Verrucomicrobiales bacterium]